VANDSYYVNAWWENASTFCGGGAEAEKLASLVSQVSPYLRP